MIRYAGGSVNTPPGTSRIPDAGSSHALAGVSSFPTGGDMADTMIGTAAEQAEAKVRRLMAERAALPLTWETRARRAELYRQVLEAYDEWDAARGG